MGNTKHVKTRPERIIRVLNGKKAQAFAFILVLVFLVLVAIVYTVFDHVLAQALSNDALTYGMAGSEYESTYTRLNLLWAYGLAVASLFIMIYLIVSNLRRSPI